MNKSPNFQETLKRMLNTPAKENKPLHKENKKTGEGNPRQNR